MPFDTALCSSCLRSLPVTAEYWYRRANGGFYTESRCRSCEHAYRTELAERRRARRIAEAENVVAEFGGGVSFPLANRPFGVELEFCGSRRSVAAALNNRGLDASVESYNHYVQPHWKVVTDESVNSGGELVSPILRATDGAFQVTKACQGLRNVPVSVDSSCGFHAHHDVTDLNADEFVTVVKSYHLSHRAFDGLVSPSRRDGGYCRLLPARVVDSLENSAHSLSALQRTAECIDRFYTLNVECYPRYGTIEFRQHGGTTDETKVLSWVSLGQALIQAGKDDELVHVDSATDLIKALGEHGLPNDAGEFLRERARHFEHSLTRSW